MSGLKLRHAPRDGAAVPRKHDWAGTVLQLELGSPDVALDLGWRGSPITFMDVDYFCLGMSSIDAWFSRA